MTETITLKENQEGVSVANSQLNQQPIKIRGITTSQIQQALKANKTNGLFPYPARVFLKVEEKKEDIPVFFRIKDKKG
jgi:hypothetical protein